MELLGLHCMAAQSGQAGLLRHVHWWNASNAQRADWAVLVPVPCRSAPGSSSTCHNKRIEHSRDAESARPVTLCGLP